MPPISARRDNPTPEISFAEVAFSDEADLGAGKLELRFRAGALNGEMPFFFVVEQDPGLHLGIRLRPRANEVSVVLGRLNRSTFTSTSEKLGNLATRLNARTQSVLKLEWEAWAIGKIELDGNAVEITRARSPHSEGALKMFGDSNLAAIPPIDGILPPNAPIPEHEATVFILVPQRNALPGLVWNHMAALMDTSQRVEIYQVRQGNTEIEIIRADDGSFVYSRSNPSVGVRTIRVPCGDVTTPDLTGYSILASWSPTKDTLVVSLMNNRAAEVVHREASAFAGSKLAEIRERLGVFCIPSDAP